MTETRKLAAILVADVVGYSRLAGVDEERTLARLRALRSDLLDPTIALHRGRIVKRTGDGSIIEFRSVVDAVRCAIEVQNGMLERNAGVAPERRIEFRVGIHLGDGAQAVAKPGPIPASEKSSPPRLSMVVLPFANIGGDPEQEHFVDGVTESLTTDLSRLRGSLVIGRNTAFTYKGKAVDLKQVGRELNVRYVRESCIYS